MYLPAHFEENRVEELHRIITEFPFGALVMNGPNGLDANHFPFMFDVQAGGQGKLLAHVARNNPVWQDACDGDDVLVIFRAGQAYVSPNWLPSKHEEHRQVPTWNYQVVNVHGKITIRDDARFLRGLLARLTRTHEARMGEAKPWKMGDADPAFIDGRLAEIVGIEIDITKIVGKSKLSQNKDARDRAGIVQALRARGEDDTANAMLNT
ncbi:FMN-binding negative transcriptional regulator [Pigmentiphaga aceris]|uniref:FMN-binding negative transcriptional regulator n=1 Tax=Pigmentiphaga aceris TaxID=1940612 RepID=A0A5C0AUX8_9BURK|nr:FMN-binding negative transcriptional regulator [Pigmentiphaga aceris]QEI06229.1 FMN-binding negative transcriptional regulator [Pigmentiphaga aceris]